MELNDKKEQAAEIQHRIQPDKHADQCLFALDWAFLSSFPSIFP